MSTAVPILASPAWATKRCPGLVIADERAVECKVVNYGTTSDTGVVMTIFDAGGDVVNVCGPFTIPPKGSRYCMFGTHNGTSDVGCEVTGEGTNARASFYVVQSGQTTSSTVVECH
jgi:hypothetical protein